MVAEGRAGRISSVSCHKLHIQSVETNGVLVLKWIVTGDGAYVDNPGTKAESSQRKTLS